MRKLDGNNDEGTLIKALSKGDEYAFEILFHRYKKRVKGFIHKMLPANISSDRLVQEVFVKVWLSRNKIDASKFFSSYLFTISKNLVLDELKKAVNHKLVYSENHILEEMNVVCEPIEKTEEEIEIILQSIIQKLPKRRRQIFSLSRFDGLTYKQIASKLNITENTVDTQIRKSLQFLRQEFKSLL